MASPFTAAVTTHSKTRYICVDGSVTGSDISIAMCDPGQVSRNISAKLLIPDRPLTCAVFGVAGEGSVKCAKLLAQRLLLCVKKSFSINDTVSGVILDDIDVVVICGGYINSGDARVKELIVNISDLESFLKNRPAVIFSGSAGAASFAQYRFSPFTDFFQIDGFIEDPSMIPDISVLRKMINKKVHKDSAVHDRKAERHQYFDVIRKFSETLCGKYLGNVLTFFFTDSFSMIDRTERAGGRYSGRMQLLPGASGQIETQDVTGVYDSFFNRDARDRDPFRETDVIMPIFSEDSVRYIRPDRIGGISVCSEMNFEKFIDLVCDPDMIRGLVEFVFDKEGLLLASGLMFLENEDDFSDWLSEASSMESFTTGWIVIPDGDFIKDRDALSVYISGNGSEMTGVYRWGKRYFITIEPFSTIEIQTTGRVFFQGLVRKKVLKSGRSRRNLIIDLRKEKS